MKKVDLHLETSPWTWMREAVIQCCLHTSGQQFKLIGQNSFKSCKFHWISGIIYIKSRYFDRLTKKLEKPKPYTGWSPPMCVRPALPHRRLCQCRRRHLHRRSHSPSPTPPSAWCGVPPRALTTWPLEPWRWPCCDASLAGQSLSDHSSSILAS